MKKLIFSCLSILILATMAFSAGTATQPPKVDGKVKAPPMPIPKKGVADLIVKNVNITPPVPRQGKDMVTLKVTVKNEGNATPSKVCSLGVTLRNEDTHPDYMHQIIPWYTNNIPQLAPGASVDISHTITIPYTGHYKLSTIIITEGLQVGEENAQNNQKIVLFQVVDPPASSDLVLHSLSPTNDGRIRMKMYNKGAHIPTVDFEISYVKVIVNDTIEKSIHLRDIDPTGTLQRGETGPGSLPNRVYLEYLWPKTGSDGISLEPGHTYKVRVILDYNVRISEVDRSNNAMTVIWGMTP